MYDEDEQSPTFGRLLYTEREPEFDQFDREHFEALADVKATACPGCGEQLSRTQDPDIGWEVTSEQCDRCETVAYTRARAEGKDDAEARELAAPAGRIWNVRAVPHH